MKRDFTIEILAENNFSILNRIVNVLNRRRVRIKKLMAHEYDGDFRKGSAILLLHTTEEMIDKVKPQLEKLIEVEDVRCYEGSHAYIEFSERIVDVD